MSEIKSPRPIRVDDLVNLEAIHTLIDQEVHEEGDLETLLGQVMVHMDQEMGKLLSTTSPPATPEQFNTHCLKISLEYRRLVTLFRAYVDLKTAPPPRPADEAGRAYWLFERHGQYLQELCDLFNGLREKHSKAQGEEGVS